MRNALKIIVENFPLTFTRARPKNLKDDGALGTRWLGRLYARIIIFAFYCILAFSQPNKKRIIHEQRDLSGTRQKMDEFRAMLARKKRRSMLDNYHSRSMKVTRAAVEHCTYITSEW